MSERGYTHRSVEFEHSSSDSVEISTHLLTYPTFDLRAIGHTGPWATLCVGNGCEEGSVNLTPSQLREVIVMFTKALEEIA